VTFSYRELLIFGELILNPKTYGIKFSRDITVYWHQGGSNWIEHERRITVSKTVVMAALDGRVHVAGVMN
jgi:hypothetical protein